MIDRKYNRTADTGRFEMIHRGTPVPVPIYVGIDLRVEGKTCKTGRPVVNNPLPPPPAAAAAAPSTNTTNNSAANLINPSVPAPPQLKALSPVSSSSSNTSPETRPVVSQPVGALNTHPHSFTMKAPAQPVTLKLRREMTQPTLSRVELVSTLDNPLEKLAVNENLSTPYRANVKLAQNQHTTDYRHRQIRINASRLSAEYFPVRQVSRTRVNDHLPSPKGKQIDVYLR